MDPRLAKVRDDLRYVFAWFPLQCLLYVKSNSGLLIRNVYVGRDGKGCLFNLLSRPLPASERIDSRETLTRFFTGGNGDPYREQAEYQPARWLVRLIDGERVARYGGLCQLSYDTVLETLNEAIAQRLSLEAEADENLACARLRLKERQPVAA